MDKKELEKRLEYAKYMFEMHKTDATASYYMGYMDMLGKFFKTNQNSVDSNNRNIGEKFYL